MQKIKFEIDWSELDLFGHVNNVTYFKYMQTARIKFCESIGLSTTNEPDKLSFIVAASHCDFRLKLTYPGEVTLRTAVEWTKTTSFKLVHTLLNKEENVVSEGYDILVLYDYRTFTKMTIPETLKTKLHPIDNQ